MPCQLFVPPLSFDTGNNTSQLFECIKQCFHANGLILLPESTLSKGGYYFYPRPALTHPSVIPWTHTWTHTLPCPLLLCIIASHVAGLAVMMCEVSMLPQGSDHVELYSHHLPFKPRCTRAHLAHFSAGEIQMNFGQTPSNNCESVVSESLGVVLLLLC